MTTAIASRVRPWNLCAQ